MVVSLVAGTVLRREIEKVTKGESWRVNQEQTSGSEEGAEKGSNPTKEREREEKRKSVIQGKTGWTQS